jgi:hypothetical protein
MKKILFILPVFSLAFFGCRKSPDTSGLSTSFAVQTSKGANADFASYNTYSISDTINLRTTNPSDTVWDDANAKILIDRVKANMEERGYTFVPHGGSPNLALALTAVKDLNIGVVYPGWWWGGYWGCYWYYCGYPPYYGWGAVYSIPTGTLVLDMIDLKNADANQKLEVIWGSVMTGGLGNTSNDLELGVEAINQAFDQSSYIQTN